MEDDMAIIHVNRRGQTYYLHVGRTKIGKAKYFFSQESGETLAEEVPAGFEIYEHIRGQVYLRCQRPKLITDEEVLLVDSEMKKTGSGHHRVERDLKILTVYAADFNALPLDPLFGIIPLTNRAKLDDALKRALTYEAVFRFVLAEPRKRLFQAERYCYFGSVD